MRTKDGYDVPWDKSRASITSLTKTEVEALRTGDAASKCVAYARITEGQFSALFGPKPRQPTVATKRRLVGQRILAHNVFDYCRGIGERRLWTVFGRASKLGWDRKQIIKELLSWS